MEYFFLFFVLYVIFLVLTSIKNASNKPNLCKRHSWVRIDLNEESSYLKCSVCSLVAGNEQSFEEREPK